MVADATATASGRLVARVVDGDASRLKALASAIASQPGHAALLVSRTSPALAVVARAADLTLRSDQVVSALVKRFNGKGGGKPDLAQCGSLQAEPDVVLATATEALSSPS
ncbi:MAG: DHHA1 domain-containing protein [Vicinamibacterales bacterium]